MKRGIPALALLLGVVVAADTAPTLAAPQPDSAADRPPVTWNKGKPSRPLAFFVTADIDLGVQGAITSGQILDTKYEFRRAEPADELIAKIEDRCCGKRKSWLRLVGSEDAAEIVLTIVFNGKFEWSNQPAVGQVALVRMPDGSVEQISYVGIPSALEKGIWKAFEDFVEEWAD